MQSNGKVAILAIIVAFAHIRLAAQTEQLQHIHDTGWGLHSATLTVTSDSLLISSQTTFRASNGLESFCDLPTVIPIANIVKASAQPYRGFLGVDGQVTELHLEIRDQRGKKSSLNFVSSTAVHDNENRWHEGKDNGNQVRAVAQALKDAIAAREHGSKGNDNAAQHAHEVRDGSKDPNTSPNMQAQMDSSRPTHYEVQLVGPTYLNKVTVWPTAEFDPSYLYIYWPASQSNQVVKLEDISKSELKQRVLEYGATDPNIIFQGGIGGPKKAKVYELSVETNHEGRKFTYLFVSDTATCEKAAPCREGIDGGQHVRDLADAVNRAIQTRNATLRRAKEQEAEQRAAPSGLVTAVHYDDSHSLLPGGRINAGDKAELVVSVENHGPGTAYQVLISATANRPAVRVNGEQNLGNLTPGQKREIRLPIEARLDLTEGDVTVSVDVREEQREFKARRVDVIIPTSALKPSQLAFEDDPEINDGNTGFARGNGNKIPENGEQFELQAFVHNAGTEPAVGVVLSTTQIPEGIEPVVGSSDLGMIRPGETKQGKLAFAVSRTWSGSSLDIRLKASDGRGERAGVATRIFIIKAASHLPELYAATRILVNGRVATELANSQNAELEITPQNDGEIEAVGVFLRVTAPGVVMQNGPISIGAIRPHEKHLPQRIQFSLPRAFPYDRLPIRVELSQKDFPAQTVNTEFAVKRRVPDLQARVTVDESADPEIIEQNQTAIVSLELVNKGTLPAQEVVAEIDINSRDVTPLDPLQVRIGEIVPGGAASAKFRVHAGVSAQPGQLNLRVSVLQADFPALVKTAPLEVRPQRSAEVHVVPAPAAPVLPVHHVPPTVVFSNLQNGDHSREGVINVVGLALSNRHINHIEVVVGDRHIPDDLVQKYTHLMNTEQGAELLNFAIPVPLDFGKNKIQLTAYDQDNQRGRGEITIVRDKPVSMKDIETQRLEVVELRVQTPTGSGGGSGFYVGKDETYGYFATACHVLEKEKNVDDLVDSAELKFYLRDAFVKAQVLSRHDFEEDLAVVYIPIKDVPSDLIPMAQRDPSVGLPIHIIGNPSYAEWAVWQGGNVLSESPANGKGRKFTTTANESLAYGFSGGPVFDEEGNLLGMHLSGNESGPKIFANNLKSAEIFRLLKTWGVWKTPQERLTASPDQ